MKILVTGGDARMDFAARALQREGYTVVRQGEIGQVDALVLPVRGTAFSKEQLLQAHDRGCRIIGGMLPITGERCFDYLQNEAFLYENAHVTAEGAVILLGSLLEGTLFDCDVGVIGMGRIAECLCMLLRGMGARVTVYARRHEVLARARALGAQGVCIRGTLPTDAAMHTALLNTVPSPVLDREVLEHAAPGLFYLELASMPGGVDVQLAERYGIRVVNGQGIPGKYAPRAAGELIAAYASAVLKGGSAT